MNKPEFNDPFVKPRIRKHKTFGGNVVWFFYGAKDANGNPTAPNEDADDGHGTWYGIECNGDYTMFSWTHSKDEGGNTEYGTDYKENALEQMESDVLKKKELARQAEVIASSYEGEDGEQKLAEIKSEMDAMKDWHTPVESECAKRYQKAVDSYAPRLAALTANRSAKQEILDSAAQYKESTDWKAARKALDDLKDKLDDLGSAGEEADAKFRSDLNEIQRDLRKRQREYYDNLDQIHAAAEEKKKELIAETEKLVADVKNYKTTGDKLNDVMNQWKAAGSAGHDKDEELWQQFNQTRQKFYDDRKQFFSQRNAEWKKSAETKKELIQRAAEISAKKDYSRENTEAMKQLDVEWKAAGFSGRDQNEKLWEEFSKTKEEFWDGKKAQADARVKGQLDAKQSRVDALEREIEDLKDRMGMDDVKPVLRDANRQKLEADQQKLESAKAEVEELQKRLAE